eukprot:TRINITY_DN7226_c0_g1_i1.p1 TRINITY_DN7226_c0_g1~~TRINITY_DN7226_c0_g1_i1.p1  ORF type:complete len:753 (-),score=288.36 TRINITY_DN7226_c0_g1_i1:101-2359(-)
MSSARIQAVGIAAALLSSVQAVRQASIGRQLLDLEDSVVANATATKSVSMAGLAKLLATASGKTLIEPCGGNIRARWNQAATAAEIRELIREDRIWQGISEYLDTSESEIIDLGMKISKLEKKKADVPQVEGKASVSANELEALLLQACKEALAEPLANADEVDIEEIFSALQLGNDQTLRLPGEIKKGVRTLDECVILGYGYRLAMETDPVDAFKEKALALLAGKKLGDSKATCQEYLNCEKFTFSEDLLTPCSDMELDDVSAEKICETLADETSADEEGAAQDRQIQTGDIQGDIKRLFAKKSHMEEMKKDCSSMQAEFQFKLTELEAYDAEFKRLLNDEQGFDTRLSELQANLQMALELLAKAKKDLEAALNKAHLSCEEADRLRMEIARVMKEIEKIMEAIANNRAHLARVAHQIDVVQDAKKTAFEMEELMQRMKESIKEFVKQSISEPAKAVKSKLGTQQSNFPSPASLKGPMEESAMGVVEACATHKRALDAVKLAGDNSNIAFAATDIETIAPVNYSSADLKGEVAAFEKAKAGRAAQGLADICDSTVSTQAEAQSTVRSVVAKIAEMQAGPKRAFGQILTSLDLIIEAIENDGNWGDFVQAASLSAPFQQLLQGSAIMEKFQHLSTVREQADSAVLILRTAIETLTKLIEELEKSHKDLRAYLADLEAQLEELKKQLARAEEQCRNDKEEVARLRQYIRELEKVVAKTRETMESVERQLAELKQEVKDKETEMVSTFTSRLLA